MFVKLLRDWKGYRAGKVFEPTDGAAEILIRRGIAALVEKEVEQTEQGDKAKKRKRS